MRDGAGRVGWHTPCGGIRHLIKLCACIAEADITKGGQDKQQRGRHIMKESHYGSSVVKMCWPF